MDGAGPGRTGDAERAARGELVGLLAEALLPRGFDGDNDVPGPWAAVRDGYGATAGGARSPANVVATRRAAVSRGATTSRVVLAKE
ncbi:hypothetical protein [Streptomyces sp. NPDC002133]|uniref:hypothetical protein n=1 Tax=Streptomyces sp. NPDC002133 TaxID=3154409 RepID=UPI003326682C